jgi:hypothetical protein
VDEVGYSHLVTFELGHHTAQESSACGEGRRLSARCDCRGPDAQTGNWASSAQHDSLGISRRNLDRRQSVRVVASSRLTYQQVKSSWIQVMERTVNP